MIGVLSFLDTGPAGVLLAESVSFFPLGTLSLTGVQLRHCLGDPRRLTLGPGGPVSDDLLLVCPLEVPGG